MNTPLISVIIPTAGRPTLLPRAVRSAISAIPPGNVEVIIVPNGPDVSWRESLSSYSQMSSVRILPIATKHANVARNHGMLNARGKYIRFLDDDDYLYAWHIEQLHHLDQSGADVSVASVDLIDERGKLLSCWQPSDIDDFATSMLHPSRMTLPCGLLYKKQSISGQMWDENRNVQQDTAFAIELAANKELSLTKYTTRPIGVWYHHRGSRISTTKGAQEHHKNTAEILFFAISRLQTRGELNAFRHSAAIEGLWTCIHTAFFRDPSYWLGVARIAQQFAPGSRPNDPLYHIWPFSKINPVLLEFMVTPHRLLRAVLKGYFLRIKRDFILR